MLMLLLYVAVGRVVELLGLLLLLLLLRQSGEIQPWLRELEFGARFSRFAFCFRLWLWLLPYPCSFLPFGSWLFAARA